MFLSLRGPPLILLHCRLLHLDEVLSGHDALAGEGHVKAVGAEAPDDHHVLNILKNKLNFTRNYKNGNATRSYLASLLLGRLLLRPERKT